MGTAQWSSSTCPTGCCPGMHTVCIPGAYIAAVTAAEFAPMRLPCAPTLAPAQMHGIRSAVQVSVCLLASRTFARPAPDCTPRCGVGSVPECRKLRQPPGASWHYARGCRSPPLLRIGVWRCLQGCSPQRGLVPALPHLLRSWSASTCQHQRPYLKWATSGATPNHSTSLQR